MIELLGIKFTYETLAAFALFIVSEVIGLNPRLQQNSISQFIVQAARTLAPFRREDDKIARIKAQLDQIQKELKD
jgi:hypothetical protein